LHQCSIFVGAIWHNILIRTAHPDRSVYVMMPRLERLGVGRGGYDEEMPEECVDCFK
jgi:hypothetical protein